MLLLQMPYSSYKRVSCFQKLPSGSTAELPPTFSFTILFAKYLVHHQPKVRVFAPITVRFAPFSSTTLYQQKPFVHKLEVLSFSQISEYCASSSTALLSALSAQHLHFSHIFTSIKRRVNVDEVHFSTILLRRCESTQVIAQNSLLKSFALLL